MAKQPTVYLLASRRNGTLYTGVTSDPIRRIWEHRNGLTEGFTKRYKVHRLVYFEVHDSMAEAIGREKRIKSWRRAWKIELIEKTNPEWRDLWPTISGDKEMDSRLRGNDGREDLQFNKNRQRRFSDGTRTSKAQSSTGSERSRDER